jgi:two-component system, NtrC family, response regulator HydG
LQNTIKRATLLSSGNFIEKKALPAEFFMKESNKNNGFSLSENERNAIIEALDQTKNNKSEAARLLKINRKTLYNKLSFYDIE